MYAVLSLSDFQQRDSLTRFAVWMTDLWQNGKGHRGKWQGPQLRLYCKSVKGWWEWQRTSRDRDVTEESLRIDSGGIWYPFGVVAGMQPGYPAASSWAKHVEEEWLPGWRWVLFYTRVLTHRNQVAGAEQEKPRGGCVSHWRLSSGLCPRRCPF